MATATPKLNKTGLSQVWAKIVAGFVAKETGKGLSANDFTDELKKQLEGLVETGGEVNVIESISVNGVALEITDKGVNILVPSGDLASLDKVGTAQLDQTVLDLVNSMASKASTLKGYGITDAYTMAETDTQISNTVKSALTGVYKFKGSLAFAELPADAEAGHVYNVTDDFTTTDAFAEGAGIEYPAGTNVALREDGKWDCMAGTYDFSEFMMKSDLVDITEEEINEICVIS